MTLSFYQNLKGIGFSSKVLWIIDRSKRSKKKSYWMHQEKV